eukprot:TRINITY_DN2508_c0_g1_i1.p1 TRINITY_DN2508_c0_g1~~TRINITY_DN2508_c0_g1_i1.p1  ORF type:complete len:224 (-),score=31.84 TRINITY_DN2508_c0_g1_i1:100-771(-)
MCIRDRACLAKHSNAYEARMITDCAIMLIISITVVTLDVYECPLLPDVMQRTGLIFGVVADSLVFAYGLISALYIALDLNIGFDKQMRGMMIMRRTCEELTNLLDTGHDLREFMFDREIEKLDKRYTPELKMMVIAFNEAQQKSNFVPPLDDRKQLEKVSRMLDYISAQIRSSKDLNMIFLFGILALNLQWVRSITWSFAIAAVLNGYRICLLYTSPSPRDQA